MKHIFIIIHLLMDIYIASMTWLLAFQSYKYSVKFLMFSFSKVQNVYLLNAVTSTFDDLLKYK